VRIISGIYKKQRINPPSNLSLRPTTDMAKEALFNILNNNFYFDELKVLDLFSGTGSISYEFASRGCNDITAIESNSHHISFIHKTVEKLSIKGMKIIRADVFSFLKSSKQSYNIIFADPPFDMKEYEKIPNLIFEKNLLEKNGWLIIEHPININFSLHLNFSETRKYGKVNFSIFSTKD